MGRRLACLAMMLLCGAAWGAGMQRVHSDAVPVAARLKPLGRLDGAKRLRLAISLPLRNQAELGAFLGDVYRPSSPNYRKFLRAGEFAEKFSPDKGDYETMIAFARAHNLVVTGTHSNRTILDVEGAVSDIERTFHVKMQVYQHPTERRQFYAPDSEPTVDTTVAVMGVGGLDNYALPRPNFKMKAPGNATNAGSGPSGTYSGNDFRAAYVPGSALYGSGQTVALLEFDGYTTDDITYYENQAGLPHVPLTNVLLDGFSGAPSGNGGEVEVSLDIEMVISLAPQISNLLVYEAPEGEWHDILNRMATDDLAQQMSCSWYIPTGGADPVADQIFQQMAAQGQSFLNASGDSCAYSGLIDFPGDTPYVTEVGGTTLTTTGPGGAWVAETVWNWGGGTGSSGGISTEYPIPGWQQGINMSLNQGSAKMRNMPDVAMTADNVYVRADGEDDDVGGTSCAAPLWAAFTALVNQQATTKGPPVGFLNPALYALAQNPNYENQFRDIVTGNNFSPSSPTKFSAVAGYDLGTGLGTPAGTPLINALAGAPDPLAVSFSYFAATGPAGGPFFPDTETYTLTNTGTTTLAWTASAAQGWVTLSATSGTLAAGGSTAVIASLNTGAKSLVSGTYYNGISFGDSTTGTVQVRTALLNILSQFPDLSVTPTTGFTMGGSPGGPFNPSSVTYLVSNAGEAPMSWVVSNTASWLTVSPAGGTLAAGGTTSVTATPTAAAGGLTTGTYNATVAFSNLNNGAGNVSVPATLLVWAAPVITSATTVSTDQGTAFSYQIAASNSPTGYWAMGLPAGLTLNADTGLISGTTTVAGTTDVTIQATNPGGTGSATLAITVVAEPPVITSSLVATGTAFTGFSYQITATNGPTGYNATGLPAGLTVNPMTGLISGTDNITRTTSVTIFATNGVGGGNASLMLTINPLPAPVITNPVVTLCAFDSANGATPLAGLVQGTDGNLYGTTSSGGSDFYYGTVYKLTLSGSLTTLASFDGADGYEPQAALVQGTDGNFYGTTSLGGSNFDGSVFRVTPGGSLTNLYSFDFTDGEEPLGALIQARDHNFYGTTSEGGANFDGMIFKMTLSGSLTTLAPFDETNGEEPAAGVIQGTGADTNLYGTTEVGGTDDDGTVFKVSTSGALTTPVSFNGTNGNVPEAPLVQGTDSNFYGTTYSGGSSSDGNVFKMTTGGTPTSIFSFNGTNGANPRAGLFQGSDGNYYGTTYAGGPSNDGIVFSVTSSGSLTTICTFNGANGENPAGGLIQASDGYYYGTTSAGGGGYGTVFKVGPFIAAGLVGTPFSYQITASNNPTSYTVTNLPPGLGYNGTTGVISGTPTATATNAVAIAATNPTGTARATVVITVLLPQTPVITSALQATASQGQLFDYQVLASGNPSSIGVGTLPAGLSYNAGTGMISGVPSVAGTTSVALTATNPGGTGTATLIITVVPVAPVIIKPTWTLCSFSGPNGSGPASGVMQASDGNLYGTTPLNVNTGNDTVFQVTTSGSLATIVSAPDGSCPTGQLLQADDGNLYGTSGYGGSNGDGAVFQLGLSGSLNAIASFNNTNGAEPMGGGLTESGGNLYGTTYTGGASGNGSVFSMTLSGSVTTLCSFTGTNGGEPAAGLVQGNDGNFYGTTYYGGTHNDGTVFQVTSSGSLTTLCSFNGTNGASPLAGLAQGSDGNFYGTTYYGGLHGDGTVFQVTSSGSLTTLMSFNNADGGNPFGGLIQGSDGNFYGTTSKGGTGNLGTIFEVTPGGSLSTLYAFTDGTDGADPEAGLAQGNDGNLYGTTSIGGAGGGGTVFGLTPLYVTGTTGQALTYQINATNSPTSYNATGLPGGLGVNGGTGLISGTPAGPGTSNVTLSAVNTGGTGSATLVVTVLPLPPVISSPLSATAIAGAAFQYQIQASNLPTGYSATGLPAGLGVNTTTGRISGMTTVTGTSSVIITATNSGGSGMATLSLAVLPPAPSVTTGIAGGVMYNGATLNGAVNPNGSDTLSYFELGPSTTYGTTTASQDAGSGTNSVAISASLSGLAPATTYHYRLDGTNSTGLTSGSDQMFTTPAPPPPSVTTGSASPVFYNVATVGGSVIPNGLATTAYFAYGTTGTYGSVSSSQSLGNGAGAVALSGSLTGLTPNTLYHYKVVAVNSSGTGAGLDATFITTLPPPTVVTSPANAVLYSSATLNGTVNPNGLDSSAYFQWGTSTGYGNTTPVLDAGSGSSATPVPAGLTGLAPNTTYDFQLVSVNSSGTSFGINQTFTTVSPPPSVVSNAPSGVVYNGATLNASVTPNGLTTNLTFAYGTTTAYGSSTPAKNVGKGSVSLAESAVLTGLSPNTQYHYEAVAVNSSGTSTGLDETFTTSPPPPTPVTSPASAVLYNSATLNGTVNPNGLDCTAYFQWGVSTGYGNTTPAQDMGSGSIAAPISAGLTGLNPNTTYNFQLVSINVSGTFFGTNQKFTTPAPPPSTTTGLANPVGYATATLGGTVNPNGLATTAYFAYGTTASYGSVTGSQSIGSGKSGITLSGSLTGLTPDTLYHYQVVAMNSSGTSAGLDKTFTSTEPPPTAVTGTATGLVFDGVTLTGSANPNGLDTTVYFQYGATTAYGDTTTPQDIGNGTAFVAAVSPVTTLTALNGYHYRIVAMNSSGTADGADQTFITPDSQPVAVNDEVYTAGLKSVKADVLANDSDPSGVPLTVIAVTQGAFGAAVINANSTVTYIPGANFKTGDQFTYTISDGHGGTATAAVLVQNGFTTAAGTYTGLISGTIPLNANSGLLTVTTGPLGGFSGKLLFAGLSYPLAGSFDVNLTSSLLIARPPQAPLAVTLELDPGSGQLVGLITTGTVDSQCVATQLSYNATQNPAPQKGVYNALVTLDPAVSGTSVPQGHGFLSITVGPAGGVVATGKLGDGTSVSATGLIVSGTSCPIYGRLYGTAYPYAESIFGVLTFPKDLRVCSGTLLWFKPAQKTAQLYQQGFALTVSVTGSIFLPTVSGKSALAFPSIEGNETFTAEDGGLGSAFSEAVTLSRADVITPLVSGSSGLRIVISRGTGLLSGSFVPPGGKLVRLLGIVDQDDNLGAGLFLSGTGSGAFSIGAGE